MGYEAARFKCRIEGCDERFLTANARDGHESTHGETLAEVVRGP